MPTFVVFGPTEDERIQERLHMIRNSAIVYPRHDDEFALALRHSSPMVPPVPQYKIPLVERRRAPRQPLFTVDAIMNTLRPHWMAKPVRAKIKALPSLKSIIAARKIKKGKPTP